MRCEDLFHRTSDKGEYMNPSLCQRRCQRPGYRTAQNLPDEELLYACRPLDWTFIRDVNIVPSNLMIPFDIDDQKRASKITGSRDRILPRRYRQSPVHVNREQAACQCRSTEWTGTLLVTQK